MSILPASAPLFSILSALVEEYSGLHYGLSDRDIFIDRVGSRAMEVGFDSLLDYYYYLRYDPAGSLELERLVDELVVNETFFFRELEPLRVLVSELIEPRVRQGMRPRIWSAACSTGEEPLTLAMLLAEAGLLSRVDLIASDISQRALGRARAGKFGRRSMREVPDPVLANRYIREDASGLTVSAELRRSIDWRRINLCDGPSVAAIGACDVILCRNVLIYFSDETLVRVIGHLAQSLAPDGVIFVGVSESILRFGTVLECEEKNHVFFYRKRV